MFPVKIANYFNKPAPPQSSPGPGRMQPASQQPPPRLVAVDNVAPEQDRRMSTRRTMERRERDLAAFLDTRTPLGRRRSPGRRAGDQLAPDVRKSISIRA
jgi:hypothetical protein